MKSIIFLCAILISSFAMAQTQVTSAGAGAATVKPDTETIDMKDYAVKRIQIIEKQIADLQKALTIEQQIGILQGDRDDIVTTIVQERDKNLADYERYEIQGNKIILFKKKKEEKKP